MLELRGAPAVSVRDLVAHLGDGRPSTMRLCRSMIGEIAQPSSVDMASRDERSRMGDWLQVCRVHAGWDAAEMVEFAPGGDLADVGLVGDPVCELRFAVDADESVASGVSRSCPDPAAAVIDLHVSGDPLVERLWFPAVPAVGDPCLRQRL